MVCEIVSRSCEEVISLLSSNGLSLRIKINDDVRQCILSNSRAISCMINNFPVPACLKRMRPCSKAGLFTQLIVKSRNATHVPIRQPLLGLNCELNSYGISLIFASSSMTTIGSVTQKPSKDYLPMSEY